MRQRSPLVVVAVCALSATIIARSSQADFSGRWRLVQPTVAQLAEDTLTIKPPDELLITQTPFAVTVEHPSTPGTHPDARRFEYGEGGMVGGVPGRTTVRGTWSVSYVGTKLMISESTTAPDARGAQETASHGSMWHLERPNRLVIEFSEQRTGERPKVATRVYVKVAP